MSPRSTRSSGSVSRSTRTPKPNILLVTDNASLKKSYTTALKNSYKIIDAESLEADLSAAILDIDVNDKKDPFAMLLRIKKMDPQIPVMVLASEGDVVRISKARRLGADDYMLKNDPGAPRSVKARLKVIMKRNMESAKELDSSASAETALGTEKEKEKGFTYVHKVRDNVFELGYEEYVKHVQRLVLEYIETREDGLSRSNN